LGGLENAGELGFGVLEVRIENPRYRGLGTDYGVIIEVLVYK
jgi:hypothetical protein